MKKLPLSGLLTSLSIPLLALAGPFDGTWWIDVSATKLPERPEVYLLQDGVYHCKSCIPPVDIKADGQDQKLIGHPNYDYMSVKVVDDRTIELLDKKNGKTIVTGKMAVAANGKTARVEFTDRTATSGAIVSGQTEMQRIAKGPSGAHAISGSWRTTKLDNFSDNGLTFTIKVDAGTLTMSNPIGQGYSAKLDGSEAPYQGDPGTTSVSVTAIDANTIEEADRHDGKVINVSRMTVAADGNSMTIVMKDVERNATTEFLAKKH